MGRSLNLGRPFLNHLQKKEKAQYVNEIMRNVTSLYCLSHGISSSINNSTC
jgi:hypothetical protein